MLAHSLTGYFIRYTLLVLGWTPFACFLGLFSQSFDLVFAFPSLALHCFCIFFLSKHLILVIKQKINSLIPIFVVFEIK